MTTPGESEYRSRIEQWVDAGTDVFTSADKLYEALRGTELYAPRHIVRDVWNETVVAKEYLPLINRLQPDALIPRSWVKSTDQRYSEPYAVKLKVSGSMGDKGEVAEHFVTLLYDHAPTTGEVAQDYVGVMDWSGMLYDPDTLSFSVERVYHKRGDSW